MGGHYWLMLFLLLWWKSLATTEFGFNHGDPHVKCRAAEREALLHFKQSLEDPSSRLSSWVGGDCCSWRGVGCHNITGHVLRLNLRNQYDIEDIDQERSALGGNISNSLVRLKQLGRLDLSGNDFGGQQIPKFFGSLACLKYLNLSNGGFGGVVPHQLGNLSSLRYLDIGGNLEMNAGNIQWISHLSRLQFLDMTFVDLSSNPSWLQVMNTLPFLSQLRLSFCSLNETLPLSHVNMSSLIALDLSYSQLGSKALDILPMLPSSLCSLDLAYNQISGPFPTSLRNMTSLQSLNLANNMFNSIIPEWLCDIPSLEMLDLSGNDFQGPLSSAISNLTSLTELQLSGNRFGFGGHLPKSLGRICKLRVLDLSNNQISGEWSDQLGLFESLVSIDISSNSISGSVPISIEKLSNLAYLGISSNSLSGSIPISIGRLSNLVSLDISSNSISGSIPISIGRLSNLVHLDISGNSISGSIPISFGRLSSLESLDVSRNSLNGSISEIHFVNLSRLVTFRASSNPLTIRVSSNWTPPFQLQHLAMRSTRLGPQFPLWLQTQKQLVRVDLSFSQISDAIPPLSRFFPSLPAVRVLDLSNNQIHGDVPSLPSSGYVYLDSNNFSGPLPHIPFELGGLSVSNNSLSGSLVPALCGGGTNNTTKSLEFLGLSRNRLSGELPDCWGNWNNLVALSLDNNKLKGEIPASLGSLGSLEAINLRNNRFSGDLPPSMQNLSRMRFLDLSENELTGNIPQWIGENFDGLRILALRSNRLNGTIPRKLCFLNFLLVLDLAHNKLSETIPTCFDNFTGMTKGGPKPHHPGMYFRTDERISLVVKEREYEYGTASHKVTTIDLSCNSLSGDMLAKITNLDGLQALNLSFNHLQGKISREIGTMKSLESLDLSMNHLFGEIPPGIASLNFLGYLNLSYNNLSGRIPSGTQILGFSPLSFVGNHDLYGPPLTNCSMRDHAPPPPRPAKSNEEDSEEDKWIDMKWFYLCIPLGFAVGFWGVWGPLGFSPAWRSAYFCFLDDLIYRLFGFY